MQPVRRTAARSAQRLRLRSQQSQRRFAGDHHGPELVSEGQAAHAKHPPNKNESFGVRPLKAIVLRESGIGRHEREQAGPDNLEAMVLTQCPGWLLHRTCGTTSIARSLQAHIARHQRATILHTTHQRHIRRICDQVGTAKRPSHASYAAGGRRSSALLK